MRTSDLKLNDFEAFDRFIFRGSEPNWKRLYNPKTGAFYPPIPRPKSEVEHQLDHYALWMVIACNGLTSKPYLLRRRGFKPRDVLTPRGGCYACQYHRAHYNVVICGASTFPCPLTSADGDYFCGEEWRRWNKACRCFPPGSEESIQAAIDVAHIKWRELI